MPTPSTLRIPWIHRGWTPAENHWFEYFNGTPLQCSCLENPMDRGAWWAAVHGVAKSRTRLSDFTFTFHFYALEKEMATHSKCYCLENPRDRGAWWAAVYGVTQSRTRLKRLSSSSSLFLLLYFLSVTSIVPIVFHFTKGYKYAQYTGQETLAEKMTDTWMEAVISI